MRITIILLDFMILILTIYFSKELIKIKKRVTEVEIAIRILANSISTIAHQRDLEK